MNTSLMCLNSYSIIVPARNVPLISNMDTSVYWYRCVIKFIFWFGNVVHHFWTFFCVTITQMELLELLETIKEIQHFPLQSVTK